MDTEETTALIPTDHRIIIHEGADIEGYQVAGAWHVAMNRVCRTLGLDWSSQRQRIMRDPILSKGMVMITIPSAGGAQDMVGLRLDLFWGWLFKLELNRVADDVRDSLTAFQLAGYQALHDHFTGRPASPAAQLSAANLDALAAQIAVLSAQVAQARAQARQATPRPLHPAAEAILEVVRAAPEPIGPTQVARLLTRIGYPDADSVYVRVRMARLARAGRLAKIGHGRYVAVSTD